MPSILFRLLLIIMMFFSLKSIAQQKAVNSITWKIAGSLPVANGEKKALGFAGAVSGLHNNVLIIAGGANFPDTMPWLGGRKKYYDDVYVFRNDKKHLRLNNKTFKLPNTLAYAAICSTPLGILCAGGENAAGISNKVILIQWDNAKGNIVFKNLPNLPLALTNAAVTAKGNTIYLAGGETNEAASNLFLSLNLNNVDSGWKQLPQLPHAVSHAVLVEQSNGDFDGIYLIGGRRKTSSGISELYSTVYNFDSRKREWNEKKSLPYNLSAGVGVAAGADYILLFGGDKGETFHKTEILIGAINAEKDPMKKEELNQQKIQLQSSHPGFSKEVLLYNTVTNQWNKMEAIPFDVAVTTNAVKWGNCVLIPSGEIKAGVRTPQILAGKLMLERQ